MIKRFLIAASLVLAGALCFADEQMQAVQIGPFAGLNTNVTAEALDSTQSPDLLNVDISRGGKSVKKRQGYGIDTTLAVSTSSVHNLYKFFDSSGNEVRLAFNDNKISSSINGATWSTILTTGTVGATWDCTDYLGFAYCVSSSFDNPIKTNGTSAGTTGAGGTNAVPAGSIIANSGDRLLVGSTSANPSRLYYSASAVFSDFSLGTQSSSSSFEDLVAPGSKLTHISYRFGKWLWWKDQSFGFIVGTGQFDLQIVIVSNSIGTLDNTDVFDGNYLYFRGSDSQIYTYDGSNLSRAISQDIAPTLRSTNRKKFYAWTQTNQSDFASGSAYATFTDTTSSPGNVVLSSLYDNFQNLNNWSISSGTYSTNAGGGVVLSTGNFGTYSISASTYGVSLGSAWYMSGLFSLPIASPVNNYFATLDSSGNGYGFKTSRSGATYTLRITKITGTSTFSDISVLIASSTSDTQLKSFELSRTSTGAFNLSFAGVSISTAQDTSYNASNSPQIYCVSGITPQITISSFNIVSSTGTFYSAVKNAPVISSWNSFLSNALTNGGTLNYFVRSSTNPFSVTSSTPSWVAQTNGSTVSSSTGTYFQARIDFAITASTQTPTINDFTFNYIGETVNDKMYGSYFNNAIWFSVSLGTSTTANNRIFRYDLISNLWTPYDIAANGFLTYNNGLYFGDPTAGKIYQFGNGVYSDNGSAINAYWKSKPLFGESPFTDDDLRQESWYIAEASGTTLNLTYRLNEFSDITRSISLYDARKDVIQNNWNFPIGSTGTTFSVKFGDNSTNIPWEVFGGAVWFVPRPWRISLQ